VVRGTASWCGNLLDACGACMHTVGGYGMASGTGDDDGKSVMRQVR
jgi:hypothetical protein